MDRHLLPKWSDASCCHVDSDRALTVTRDQGCSFSQERLQTVASVSSVTEKVSTSRRFMLCLRHWLIGPPFSARFAPQLFSRMRRSFFLGLGPGPRSYGPVL